MTEAEAKEMLSICESLYDFLLDENDLKHNFVFNELMAKLKQTIKKAKGDV